VYPNINRKEYARTPYPPVAQIIFAISNLIKPLGVTTLKMIWVLFECATVWAIIRLLETLKMNPARVIVYAWCPLAVWEISQNGHLDAASATFIALAGLAGAKKRTGLAGVLIALATMVKLFPGILAAAIWKKWDRKLPVSMGVTLGLFYLPYLGVGREILGFVTHYPSEEGFFSGERYLLLKWIHTVVPLPALAYLGGFVLLLGVAAIRLMLKSDKSIEDQLRGCTLLAGLILFFISPQYGWYYLWLLPFLAITLERVSLLQVVSVMTIAAAFLRYHAARVLTPDMAVAPITVFSSLRQRPSVQWLWLVLIASAAWLSWI
jgi:alpha-1,6-mannosyltransferase